MGQPRQSSQNAQTPPQHHSAHSQTPPPEPPPPEPPVPRPPLPTYRLIPLTPSPPDNTTRPASKPAPKHDPRPFALPQPPMHEVVLVEAADGPKPKQSQTPTIELIFVLVLLVVAGVVGLKSTPRYLSWKNWIGKSKYWKVVRYPLAALVILLALSYIVPIWPFCLAAELGAVAVGVTAGWCGLDYERMKVTTIPAHLKKNGHAELDDLGFFNARVAMRNRDLFRISIADIPMEPEQRAAAQGLVDRYWHAKENGGSKETPAA